MKLQRTRNRQANTPPVHSFLALVVALAVSACGASAGTTPKAVNVGGAQVPVAQLSSVLGGLCDTRRAGTDAVSARTAFYNHAHENLHVLATATEVPDRRAAGRLLEAMQRVEADLAPVGDRTLLPTHVNELLRTARASLDRLDIPSRSCQEADTR